MRYLKLLKNVVNYYILIAIWWTKIPCEITLDSQIRFYTNKSAFEIFILYNSYYATIGTMLLLESSGVSYSNFP